MMRRLDAIISPSASASFPSLPSFSFSNDYAIAPFTPGYSTDPSQLAPVTILPQQPYAPPLYTSEIRTEADLTMFNQFMVSLGRDTINEDHLTNNTGTNFGQSLHRQDGTASMSPLLSDQLPVDNLFNSNDLAALGLVGMPGIPTADVDLRPSPMDMGYSANSSFGLYPTLDNMHANRARGFAAPDYDDFTKRTIAGLPRVNAQPAPPPKPTYLSNIYGLGPTQYAELPSFIPNKEMGHTALGPTQHQFASFDSLARSKSQAPPATIAPKQYYKKTYRHVAPLGTAMSSRSRQSAERTEMNEAEDLEEEDQDELDFDAATPKISVRSLLLSDDQADLGLKLPAIHSDPEESPHRTILPPFTDLAQESSASSSRTPSPPRQLPAKRHTEEEILHGVKRLELSEEPRPTEERSRARENAREVRKRDAMMIRDWLVAVNLDWKRRGTKERGFNSSEKVQGLENLDEKGR